MCHGLRDSGILHIIYYSTFSRFSIRLIEVLTRFQSQWLFSDFKPTSSDNNTILTARESMVFECFLSRIVPTKTPCAGKVSFIALLVDITSATDPHFVDIDSTYST